MKNSILALAACTFIVGSFLTSCTSPAEKVENAQTNVEDAKKDLSLANQEYLAEIENYRKEESGKILLNEQSIADFKVRVAKEKKEVKADYEKQIAELEQKNSDMKKRLDEYKAESKEQWATFKTEFGAEMNNLGKAFKDFTEKDKKN